MFAWSRFSRAAKGCVLLFALLLFDPKGSIVCAVPAPTYLCQYFLDIYPLITIFTRPGPLEAAGFCVVTNICFIYRQCK